MMSKNELSKKITVVVIGYDDYKDIWPYFTYFYRLSGLNDNLKTVFVSAFEQGPEEFTSITANSFSAGERIKAAINFSNTDYYLILLEDYIIFDNVNFESIRQYLEFVINEKCDYLCLYNFISHLKGQKFKKLSGFSVGKIHKNRNYRINLQPSIWSKKLLINVLNNDPQTLWDLENSLNYNDDFDNVDALYVKKSKFKVINFVDKGYLTLKAKNLIKKHHLDILKRKTIPFSIHFKHKLKNFLVSLCPDSLLKKYLNHKSKYKNKAKQDRPR